MVRNSATFAVQECASKPLSTICFCSIAAAILAHFQIMCTTGRAKPKQFIFMLSHSLTIKYRSHLNVLVQVQRQTVVLWDLSDVPYYFVFMGLMCARTSVSVVIKGREARRWEERRGEEDFKDLALLIDPVWSELILRSVHKALCFSQRCTNSGIIMALLVQKGRTDRERRLAGLWK